MRQKKLYKELIQKDINALERDKGNSIKKHNILKILDNIGAIFTSAYSHQKDVPRERIFERSIAERAKLIIEKIAEIEGEEKNISNKLFKKCITNYQSPSDMHKKLRETDGSRNENRVFLIKLVLNEMKNVIENGPENKIFKIEENEKIINIVERILYFNQQNQAGQGLKILTPNQMLSRLPIFSAQLKAGNNSEKLKNEIKQKIRQTYKKCL